MKKMNKLTAAVLAAAMVGSMAVPAFAIESDGKQSSTSTADVKYEVTQGFTWSIHDEVDFGKDKGVNKTSAVVKDTTDNKVEVTKNVIAKGTKLQIKIAGAYGDTDSGFMVQNKEGVTLEYTVKSGTDEIDQNGTVLEVAAGTNTGSTDMTFTLSTSTDTAETAGTYTGTVTYTAAIVSAD